MINFKFMITIPLQVCHLTRIFQNLEDKLVLSHRQNIHELTKANKLSVDILKDQQEQKRLMDINTCKHAAKRDLGLKLSPACQICIFYNY